jgi:hypothetical protein
MPREKAFPEEIIKHAKASVALRQTITKSTKE